MSLDGNFWHGGKTSVSCPPGQVAGVLRALGYVERGGGFFSAGGEGRERKRGQARRA